jgi:hypothetical protein
MRKIAIFAVSALVLAAAAIAYAQAQTPTNTYSVSASTNPRTKGTTKAPKTVSVKFNYKVGEQNNLRPSVIEKYSIRFTGLRQNSNSFPGCTAAQINAAGNDNNCPSGSAVGTGDVTNNVGATNNQADKSIQCFLKLTVYNSRKNKAALYLEGGPQAAKPCPTAISVGIDARFVRRGATTALEFSVPESLKHPITGLSNAVVDVKSTIKALSRTVNGERKGFFEAVGGCDARGRRAVTVVFTPEQGNAATAQTFARCS